MKMQKKNTHNTEHTYASHEARNSCIPQKKNNAIGEEKEEWYEEKGTGSERTYKKSKPKQLIYDRERKPLIKMDSGVRTMNISSLNPDSMKEEQTQREIIKKATREKIRIAAVQET